MVQKTMSKLSRRLSIGSIGCPGYYWCLAGWVRVFICFCQRYFNKYILEQALVFLVSKDLLVDAFNYPDLIRLAQQALNIIKILKVIIKTLTTDSFKTFLK